VVMGAVYAIGSHLLEIISTILKGQSGYPLEYSQKFLGFLRSSRETLPVFESQHDEFVCSFGDRITNFVEERLLNSMIDSDSLVSSASATYVFDREIVSK
jgi:hypothetical protein